jgi:hypothetical protein
MRYPGPTTDDLADVHALNLHYLNAIRSPSGVGFAVPGVRRLTPAQCARLAETPFLLFSFRERDAELWRTVLGEGPQLALIPADEPPSPTMRELCTAGLSFLWQLSRRNAYAARVVSGAPVRFCEHLAASTLIGLLRRTAHRSDLLVPRYADEQAVWRQLLAGGVSATRQVQAMSQQSALQRMLTVAELTQHAKLPAAASRFPGSGRRSSNRRYKV